jgi:hypothetical protein
MEYQDKDKKLLSHDYDLVYPSTSENISERLY